MYRQQCTSNRIAQIHKHTAFIKGMFTSQLEASKFEGASVRTVSGIRGSIKRALRKGTGGGPDGSVRITFEDKPVMSDIVFLRAFVQVDLPKLHNPVTNLLAPQASAVRGARALLRSGKGSAPAAPQQSTHTAPHHDARASKSAPAESASSFVAAPKFLGARPGHVFKVGHLGLGYYADTGVPEPPAAPESPAPGAADRPRQEGWVAMKTVAQLRRELGQGAPRNSDSLYRPIERAPRRFAPLKVPTALQKQLPFKSKPKVEAPRKRPTLEQRRAVVLEPGERKQVTLLQQLNTIRNRKAEARRQAVGFV